MNSRDINNAIKARLASIATAPSIAWSNVEFDAGTVPRWEVTIIGNGDDPSLKGSNDIYRVEGTVEIVICTAHGEGENAGLDYLDAIRATFQKGTTVAFTGGIFTVLTEPTQSIDPFPDDTAYRIPASFTFVANAT